MPESMVSTRSPHGCQETLTEHIPAVELPKTLLRGPTSRKFDLAGSKTIRESKNCRF